MRKMRFFFGVLILVFLTDFLHSQNLVINSGFEEIDSASVNLNSTDSLAVYGVRAWYSPTTGTPNYFSINSKCYERNKSKTGGEIQPHTGNAFTGFVMYWNSPDNYKEYNREYVGGKLAQPLEAGRKYHISFSIALGLSSTYSTSEIGILFSKNKIYDTTVINLKSLSPSLIIDLSTVFSTKGQWEEISCDYTAEGGENYFILGDFKAKVRSLNAVKLPSTTYLWAFYYFDDVYISLASNDNLDIGPGKKLVTQNIYFAKNDSILSQNSYPILDKIILAMKNQPALNVEICGHTDSIGTIQQNQRLSEGRARAVRRYFISKGIDAKRIKTTGYGEAKPIGLDPAENRRVEFIFS